MKKLWHVKSKWSEEFVWAKSAPDACRRYHDDARAAFLEAGEEIEDEVVEPVHVALVTDRIIGLSVEAG